MRCHTVNTECRTSVATNQFLQSPHSTYAITSNKLQSTNPSQLSHLIIANNPLDVLDGVTLCYILFKNEFRLFHSTCLCFILQKPIHVCSNIYWNPYFAIHRCRKQITSHFDLMFLINLAINLKHGYCGLYLIHI